MISFLLRTCTSTHTRERILPLLENSEWSVYYIYRRHHEKLRRALSRSPEVQSGCGGDGDELKLRISCIYYPCDDAIRQWGRAGVVDLK